MPIDTDHAAHQWSHHSAQQINEIAANPDAIVLLPVAAIEQHGPHLPTLTDTALATALCLSAAENLGPDRPALVLPPVWTGMSDHHLSFGGTISLTFDEFTAVLTGIVRSVEKAGFKRMALVNAHGGNIDGLSILAVDFARQFGISVVAVTPWELARQDIGAMLTSQPGVMHACEAETSLMLHLCPDLVHLDRLALRTDHAVAATEGFETVLGFRRSVRAKRRPGGSTRSNGGGGPTHS
ncbi:creatininase family protein [Sulfitobacter porphyrae]|uniref:Creatininase family protein n=1 Tax=Sulfitobacter porphyrae TaxID=1246864 RepID=A0ABW2B994_9RHOB